MPADLFRACGVPVWRALGLRRRGLLVAALVLALGFAPGLALLSVLRASVLNPFPYRQPDRLVAVRLDTFLGEVPATAELIQQWALRRDLFDAFGTFAPERARFLRLPHGSRQLDVSAITPGLLATLGVRPELGPGLGTHSGPAVLLSDALWRSTFGADLSVVGRVVDFSGKPYTVAGVMPPSFAFPQRIHPSLSESVEAWPRLDLDLVPQKVGSYLGIGRLRNGGSAERAAAALTAGLPPMWRKLKARVTVTSLRDLALEPVDTELNLATAAAVLVLALACVNAAALFLLDCERRRRELAVRLALGAGHGRIARSLLAQALGTGFCGAALGGGGGLLGARAITVLLPPGLPLFARPGLDGWVAAAAAGCAVVAAAAAALTAIGTSFRTEPAALLADAGGREAAQPRAGARFLRVAVAIELTLALGLATAGVLTARGYGNLLARPRNYTPAGLEVCTIKFSPTTRILVVTRQLHMATAVLSALVPFTSTPVRFSFAAHGPAPPPGPGLEGADYAAVSPSYFSLLRIPLFAGRIFAGGSRSDEAVIDQRMAREIIGPDANLSRALGATVQVLGTDARVVGVVATAHALTGEPHTSPQIYRPYLTDPAPITRILVRSSLPPRALQDELQALASRMAPDAEVYRVRRLPDLLRQAQAIPRFQASLFSILGLISVLLAALGVFSVLAAAAMLRGRDYAIRISLGAAPNRIRSEVLADALRLLWPGVVAGLGVALLAAHLLAVGFPQVSSRDGAGVALGVLAALAGAALAAACATLPAVNRALKNPLPLLQRD